MTTWNFAQVWREIGLAQPERIAIRQGDQIVSWGEFLESSLGFATWMRQRGVVDEAKVAQYLYNCQEYMIAVAGALFIISS